MISLGNVFFFRWGGVLMWRISGGGGGVCA